MLKRYEKKWTSFMNTFTPKLTITNRTTAAITQVERARGF